MRRLAKSLLLMLAALFYAGSASAVVIELLGPAGGVIYPGSEFQMDVMLDTEGIPITYYQFEVLADPMVLGLAWDAQIAPEGMEVFTSDPYVVGPGALITGAYAPSSSEGVVVEQIVLQLSAEVHPDLPPGAITSVTLSVDGEESGIWLPGEIWLDPAEITLSALELHAVPEPTTALLLALGLVGLSWRQRRAT